MGEDVMPGQSGRTASTTALRGPNKEKHMQIRRTAVAITSAAALSVTGIAMASPANAQPNRVDQEGLINLALVETNVQVPIGIAANICGVAVNALATETLTGPVNCEAQGVGTAERDGGGDGGNRGRQSGLVNVFIADTTVQIPVAVAANVCGVTVNLIASQTIVGETTCEALAESGAEN
jgi:hypothetical protein